MKPSRQNERTIFSGNVALQTHPIFEVKHFGTTIEFSSSKVDADIAFKECNKNTHMYRLDAMGHKTCIERK